MYTTLILIDIRQFTSLKGLDMKSKEDILNDASLTLIACGIKPPPGKVIQVLAF